MKILTAGWVERRGEERNDQNYFSSWMEREREREDCCYDDLYLMIVIIIPRTCLTAPVETGYKQNKTDWTAETNWFLLRTGLAPGYQLMKFSAQFYFLSLLSLSLMLKTFTIRLTHMSHGCVGAQDVTFQLSLSS